MVLVLLFNSVFFTVLKILKLYFLLLLDNRQTRPLNHLLLFIFVLN